MFSVQTKLQSKLYEYKHLRDGYTSKKEPKSSSTPINGEPQFKKPKPDPPSSSSSSSSKKDWSVSIIKKDTNSFFNQQTKNSLALIKKKRASKVLTPDWHAPWKLKRVIAGHLGWVRAVAVDWSNEWFATGAADRTIKIWDLASGQLKLTLTGHIATLRAICISKSSPYMFSAAEDKTVKCWDLEVNKVIRHYHGHLSAVYCMALHPTLDVLITGGRDSVARVWDIRTREEVHILTGHKNTVSSVIAQSAEPQVVTGGMDCAMRLWDLAAGKTRATITNHKKSIRSLAFHPTQYAFVSGAADNLKKWKCPNGKFLQNFSGHNAIINTMSINNENVLISGGDNGTLQFWDWKTAHCYQKINTIAQSGSLSSELGIFCSTFDHSGSRLITGEADKTIKVWAPDDKATPETHPVKSFKPNVNRRY